MNEKQMKYVAISAPVLSIWQPWPYAIFRLGKRVENRNYWIPKDYRGKVWIHSCLTRQAIRDYEDVFGKQVGYQKFNVFNGTEFQMSPYIYDETDLAGIFGHILGYADIVGCFNGFGESRRFISEHPHLRDGIERWFIGNYGWVLDNTVLLQKPIAWRGTQGFRPSVVHSFEALVKMVS